MVYSVGLRLSGFIISIYAVLKLFVGGISLLWLLSMRMNALKALFIH